MQQKAPPIQWLPVFEAAARLLNFKKAAAELCVTPPAVSQQIKVLEEYLGVSLFDRNGRKLRLSQAGEFYYGITSNIIKSHTKGYRDFERKFRNPVLHVSAPIFIAQEMLIPNYVRFKQFDDNVELRITTGNEYVDFENESVDAALRFGTGDWPELDCRFISEVDLKFVCNQDYIDQNNLAPDTLISKETLEDQVLISLYDDMRDWYNVYPDLKPKRKMICDSYFAAMRSAEEGLGIAVGLSPVINRLINEDRLIILNSKPLTTGHAYWLVTPKVNADSDHVTALYNWIKVLFSEL